jgi:hypothetical protein
MDHKNHNLELKDNFREKFEVEKPVVTGEVEALLRYIVNKELSRREPLPSYEIEEGEDYLIVYFTIEVNTKSKGGQIPKGKHVW